MLPCWPQVPSDAAHICTSSKHVVHVAALQGVSNTCCLLGGDMLGVFWRPAGCHCCTFSLHYSREKVFSSLLMSGAEHRWCLAADAVRAENDVSCQVFHIWPHLVVSWGISQVLFCRWGWLFISQLHHSLLFQFSSNIRGKYPSGKAPQRMVFPKLQ